MTVKILVYILILIESGGNDQAIGDNGRAVGCLQIHSCVIEDVNRIYGTTYTLKDRFLRSKSLEIFAHYINYYCTKKRLGYEPTAMDFARIWNGGPNGHKKTATLPYWNKVITEYHKRNDK